MEQIEIKGGWLHGGLHPEEVDEFADVYRAAHKMTAYDPRMDVLVKEYRRQQVRAFRMDVAVVTRSQFMTWYWQATAARTDPQADLDRSFWKWYEENELGPAEGPITGVTLTEARMFAWSQGGRLPTEAEYEWAIRGRQASGFIDSLGSLFNQCRFGEVSEMVEGVFDLPCTIPVQDRNRWTLKLEGAAIAKPLCHWQAVLHTAIRQAYEPPFSRDRTGRRDGRYLQLGAPGFRCVYDL